MAATASQIRDWFDRGVREGATHMIVKCDSYANDSECCYPVFVGPSESVRVVDADNHDRTMEVYNLALDKESQMSQNRAFNY